MSKLPFDWKLFNIVQRFPKEPHRKNAAIINANPLSIQGLSKNIWESRREKNTNVGRERILYQQLPPNVILMATRLMTFHSINKHLNGSKIRIGEIGSPIGDILVH